MQVLSINFYRGCCQFPVVSTLMICYVQQCSRANTQWKITWEIPIEFFQFLPILVLLVAEPPLPLTWPSQSSWKMNEFLSPRPLPQIRAFCWDFSPETEISLSWGTNEPFTDPLADVFSLLAPDPGIAHLAGHDCREKFLLVLSLEGRMACHHLVQHHSEGPPVNLW